MVDSKATSSGEPSLYKARAFQTAAVARVASAYASRETSTVAEILELVDGLSRALYVAEQGSAVPSQGVIEPSAPTVAAVPAVPIEEAVQEDYVVCLCCGKSFTMLKRHLKAEHGLSEEDYRRRFSLPDSFPLVAPAYSARKAQYAKTTGLGKHDRSS